MVKGLYYNSLCNANLSGCANRSIRAVIKSNIPGITESDKFITLLAAFDQFEVSLTRKRGSIYTVLANECAATLSKTCVGFKSCVKNMTNSPNSTICANGKLLLSSLDTFDYNLSDKQGPTLAPYARNIVREFSNQEYVAPLSSDPMLNTWLTDIQTSLNAFDDVADLKDNDLLSRGEVDCASKQKMPLTEALNAFYLYVMGMMLTSDDPDWKKLHDILVDRFKTASRTKTSTNSESETSTDTVTDQAATDNPSGKV